jgi:nicotinamidase-related amidase
MTAMITLAGRYYRMHPSPRFLGFGTKTLDLPTADTAVLAVDIYGQHDRPDVWSALIADDSTDRAQAILRDRIGPALDAARAAGLPVIYVANSAPRIALRHSAYGELKWDTLGVDQDEQYAETGVDPAEYHVGPSEVLRYGDADQPKAGDYYVRKHVHSGFFDTRLDTLLRNLGIRNLICVGFALDVCLGTTMIDAVWRNYRVVLLRDCTQAIELLGIDEPGAWTNRWITYVECNIGCTSTSDDFIQACRAATDRSAAAAAGDRP